LIALTFFDYCIFQLVLLLEMGHTHTTAIVVEVTEGAPVKRASLSASDLGAVHFDFRLFDHFAAICALKSRADILPGSKAGKRLLIGCEKIRKLLSQVKESSITVENLTDSGDVNFQLTRAELSSVCDGVLQRLRNLITDVLAAAGLSGPQPVAAVEIVGGGVRMQVVQAVVSSIIGEDIPLGAKLDDNSIALVSTFCSGKHVGIHAEGSASCRGNSCVRYRRRTCDH